MITINGNGSTPQPTKLNERPRQIITINESIDGSRQGDYTGYKWDIEMFWDGLTPTNYQLLMGMFTGGSAVTYLNTTSNASGAAGGVLTVLALPDQPEPADYMRGTSLRRGLSVVLRET